MGCFAGQYKLKKIKTQDISWSFHQWWCYPSCCRLADGHCYWPDVEAGGWCRQRSGRPVHAAWTLLGLCSTKPSVDGGAWQQGMHAAPCNRMTCIPTNAFRALLYLGPHGSVSAICQTLITSRTVCVRTACVSHSLSTSHLVLKYKHSQAADRYSPTDFHIASPDFQTTWSKVWSCCCLWETVSLATCPVFSSTPGAHMLTPWDMHRQQPSSRRWPIW